MLLGSSNWEKNPVTGNREHSLSPQEGACLVGQQPPSAWQWTRLAGPHGGMCCFCPSASCSIPLGWPCCWQPGASRVGKQSPWAQMPNIILFAGCDQLGEPCPVQCPLQSQKCSIILTLSASLLMEVTLMGTGTGGGSGHGSELGPEAVLGKCSPPQCGSSPQIQRKRCTVSLSCHLWPH